MEAEPVSASRVRVCVLRGLGINADEELALAFSRIGATVESLHVGDLVRDADTLDRFHVLAVPGGFSFGDHLGSGRVLAMLLRRRAGGALRRFVDSGRLAIGICNGFQVLVKAGVLPNSSASMEPEASLIHNDSGKFEDRWVRVRANPLSPCVWTAGLPAMELPVRHGEGKFVVADGSLADRLTAAGQIALVYARRDGTDGPVPYPDNPNGSMLDAAGICDPSGRIFGLMPHPEAFIYPCNHPRWTREPVERCWGLEILRAGVTFAAAQLTG